MTLKTTNLEPKCFQKPSRKSISFLIDFGRQNGRPEASKMEPKLDQGPPKEPSKNNPRAPTILIYHGVLSNFERTLMAKDTLSQPQRESKKSVAFL